MRVSIWDMDYYYAKDKRDMFDPNLMKISSYHKQKGDVVNFVTKEDDIFRPYDLYYIFKDDPKTPNPPLVFYTERRVRWGGSCNRFRIHWRMSDAMLACRPDYLLYPEKDTVLERSEQVRLMNDSGHLLPLIQNWTNTFSRKRVICTDVALWTSPNTKEALKTLASVQNVSFLKPIWLSKLLVDEEVRELFFQLKFTPGSNLQWTPIFPEEYEEAVSFLIQFKKRFPHVSTGSVPVRFRYTKHWEDSKEAALKDFADLRRIITDAKKRKLRFHIAPLEERLQTPYFHLFEEASTWTMFRPELSWLEYITKMYGPAGARSEYWNHVERWHEVFRDLLRQTWQDHDFLLTQWGNRSVSANDIPWAVWEKAFVLKIQEKQMNVKKYKRICILDTETTDRYWNRCGPIQIAAEVVDDKGNVIDSFNERIKTTWVITPEASAVHGITAEDLKNCRQESVVLMDFCCWMKQQEVDVVLTYNGEAFDRPMLQLRVEKFGIPFDYFNKDKFPGFDGAVDVREAKRRNLFGLKDALGPRKWNLGDTANALGFSNKGAHDALVDVEMLKKVFFKLDPVLHPERWEDAAASGSLF